MMSSSLSLSRASLAMGWSRCCHAARRMGWPALLGATMMLGAVFIEEVALADLNVAQTQLRKKVGKLRTQLSSASDATAPEGQLEQLPEKQQVEELLATVHALAGQHQVLLEQGEYRLETQSGTRFARYRVVLPAKASYPNLRAWLDAVSEERAGLTLDDLAIKRENITQDVLDARITFSLLVRST